MSARGDERARELRRQAATGDPLAASAARRAADRVSPLAGLAPEEITTAVMRAAGYRCRREEAHGLECYRVRDPHGRLAIYNASTFLRARDAWAEAVTIARVRATPR